MSEHARELLTMAKLERFAEYCSVHGWVRKPTKGPHEVLRMRKSDLDGGSQLLLVHKRDHTLAGSWNVQHVTVWGTSLEWAKRFINAERQAKERK